MEQQPVIPEHAVDAADSGASARHAVQVALDRRDNGGDATSARDH
jgi:hypothetical protein